MNTKSLIFSAAALTCVALSSTTAQAEVGAAPFNPSTDVRLEELPLPVGPLSVLGVDLTLTLTPYQDVSLVMFGDGEYDFDETDITFIGTENSGVFTNTLGGDVTVTVEAGGSSLEVGVWSIEEDAVANFTPYVLPGADPRPITVAETLGPFTLVDNQEFTVPFLGNDAFINIDFRIEVPGISYRSTRIDITDDPDSGVPTELAVYDMEDSNVELTLPNAMPGDTASVWGELNGLLDSEIRFVFDVELGVFFGDTPTTVSQEFGVDIPLREDEPVTFEPEEMQFMVPEAPAPGTTGGDDPDPSTTSTTGDSDSEGTTTDDPAPDTDTDADTDSGGVPADGFGDSDSGCGCTTSPQGAGWSFGLALLGLLGLRRRRS